MIQTQSVKKAIAESRWEDGNVICPFCGKQHCYTRKDGSYRCPECGKNFSCLVGTIFENTKISFTKWFMAMYLGGRETNKHESKNTAKTQGRSTKVKQPIFGMAMVWKDETVDFETGEVKEKTHTLVNVRKVADARACTLIPIIEKYVAEGSLIVTDELSAYNSIDTTKYTHAIVRHGAKEYVVGGNSTNGIEGFWGHFKRMVFGTYHFVSKRYLQRYIDESVFRFNTKELKASDRFAAAIGKIQYKDVKIVA